MDLPSLHPFDESLAREFVRGIPNDARMQRALDGVRGGRSRAADELSFGFAQLTAARGPSYHAGSMSLTSLESQIDRGIGMLLRPPSRLLVDAGMDAPVARALAIRLDHSGGMMGGCYLPARLMPQFAELLETRMERMARRMLDAEWNAIPNMALLLDLVGYAVERGWGIYEATGLVAPDGSILGIASARVIVPDAKRIDAALQARLKLAITPPKRPGLLSRLRDRNRAAKAELQ